MSKRVRGSMAKKKACELISYYYDHHPTFYTSDEKTCYYEFAIKEAYRAVFLSDDPPLDVLDSLLVKYDEWAHAETIQGVDAENNGSFSVMAVAIENLIDLLLTS